MKRLLGLAAVGLTIAVWGIFDWPSSSAKPNDHVAEDIIDKNGDVIRSLVVDSCARVQRPIEITIPETHASVHYQPSEGDAQLVWKDDLVRGVVSIDGGSCQLVITAPGESYMVFPYVVTHQGSGAFYYLAIAGTHNAVISSQFLGDRVVIEQITVQPSEHSLFMVSIHIRKHNISQPFSEAPTVDYSQTFHVNTQGIVRPQLLPKSEK